MNREIKFRAWNKEEKVMCYDDEDESGEYRDGAYCSEVEIINNALKSMCDEYEYMQYIGRTDKNGEEIYEGDIVRTFLCIDDHGEKLYEQGVVSYDKETLGFSVFNEEGYKHSISSMGMIEVIGNIFDGIVLLEVDK